ncbi:DedA family protein [Amaricoccus solimangrovi]|uniref:DedA family protein n=1 Tax=Amaricoccus solimangrovi TaxID=2589815 RepID=A0A501WUD1_9RHOB|nr:DedA family protein [Amaricoccus solimangrovi]TPE53028.1 DedA family protein [Amaricoccus solimangrovi]
MEQWINDIVGAFGYLGIFLLMMAENLFPPIPSEVIMPIAGISVGSGQMSLSLVLISALAGTLLGNLPWYFIARAVGRERFMELVARWGKYVALKVSDVEAAIAWFDRHGGKAVLLGRMAPGVRTLISVPAGLAEMPLTRFLILSAVGSVIWIGFLIGVGMFLRANWHLVAAVIDPLGKLLLVLAVAGAIGWIAWRRWRERGSARDEADAD